MKIAGIYIIRRTGTDECYVGQSVDIHNRWRLHRQDLKAGKHHSAYLQRVVDKHGISVLTFDILETGLLIADAASLLAAEQKWIDKLKPCYNSSKVAGSTLGLKFSKIGRKNVSKAQKLRFERPDQRALMSDIRRGRPSPWRGKSPTIATRAKMSAAKKGKTSSFIGRKHTEESRILISKSKIGLPSPNKGRPMTDEQKHKISIAALARYAQKRGLGQKETLDV